MTSNAYIATDGETVMKVGKSNDVKRREREIAIPMTLTLACIDEAAAFRVESQLRVFVVKNGGIRHQQTIDWFKFDPQIYAMLCEFAAGFNNKSTVGLNNKPNAEVDVDTEIAEYIMRYHQFLVEEVAKQKDDIHRKNEELGAEIDRLKQQNIRLQEDIEGIKGVSRKNFELEMEIESLKHQNSWLQKDVEQISRESNERQERIYRLIREESCWKAKYETLLELSKNKKREGESDAKHVARVIDEMISREID